jgi:lipopolysaccharide transport system ATP-binding protein
MDSELETEEARNLLLEAKDVVKRYHLWGSPRARFVYGLWSQVPPWAPVSLQHYAARQKARFAHDFYALKGVSLTLSKGEAVGIIGRNGSGKSTLLQIIAGTLQATSGSVARYASRITALLELGSGFNPEFTGIENVLLHGSLIGLTPEQNKHRLQSVAEFADIGEFIEQPVKNYSSGMMVRLAFASATTVEPEILIVDEALSVGDIFFQQKCFKKIQDLKSGGCSLLLVSHDLSTMQEFCDRAIVLDHGQMIYSGLPAEAIKEYLHFQYPSRGVTWSVDKPRKNGTKKPENGSPADFREPSRWRQPSSDSTVPDKARLVAYAITDDDGDELVNVEPGATVRLSCVFAVDDAHDNLSPGFAVRNRHGVMILGKHLFQIQEELPSITEPGSLVKASFEFRCDLNYGEYTVEFALISIPRFDHSFFELPSHEIQQHYQILAYPPSVAKIHVVPKTATIQSVLHFGLVDVQVRSVVCLGKAADEAVH